MTRPVSFFDSRHFCFLLGAFGLEDAGRPSGHSSEVHLWNGHHVPGSQPKPCVMMSAECRDPGPKSRHLVATRAAMQRSPSSAEHIGTFWIRQNVSNRHRPSPASIDACWDPQETTTRQPARKTFRKAANSFGIPAAGSRALARKDGMFRVWGFGFQGFRV